MAQGTDLEQKMQLAGQKTEDGKPFVGRIPSTKEQMANAKYGQYASQFTVQPPEVKKKLDDVKGYDMPMPRQRSMMDRALDPTDLSAYRDLTKRDQRVLVPYKNVREEERELV